jgi:preprotein translocase subunit SecD
VSTPSASATPKKRPVTSALRQAATPTPTPTASASPGATPGTTEEPDLVRSGDIYTPAAFAALDCNNPKARLGGAPDVPTKEIVACDRFGTE